MDEDDAGDVVVEDVAGVAVRLRAADVEQLCRMWRCIPRLLNGKGRYVIKTFRVGPAGRRDKCICEHLIALRGQRE